MWWLRKLARTTRTLTTLFMARMFGDYVHSVGGDRFEYAVYRWRGETWAIPTSPMDGGYYR